MNNPLISYTIDQFKIPDVINVFKVIIEYTSGANCMKCILYDNMEEEFFTLEEKLHPIDYIYSIDITQGCTLIEQFTKIHLTLGTDKKSIYDDLHRNVEYIRFVIPDGLLQVDYEDEATALDTADTMCDFMRSFLKEV